MDHDSTKTAARRGRRRRKLGRDAACVFCGERRLVALLRKRVSIHEEDHVLGRAHDAAFTVVLCRNCHAERGEDQLRKEAPMKSQENALDQGIAALANLEAFLHSALQAVERWEQKLEDFREFLDEEFPEWQEKWRSRR